MFNRDSLSKKNFWPEIEVSDLSKQSHDMDGQNSQYFFNTNKGIMDNINKKMTLKRPKHSIGKQNIVQGYKGAHHQRWPTKKH